MGTNTSLTHLVDTRARPGSGQSPPLPPACFFGPSCFGSSSFCDDGSCCVSRCGSSCSSMRAFIPQQYTKTRCQCIGHSFDSTTNLSYWYYYHTNVEQSMSRLYALPCLFRTSRFGSRRPSPLFNIKRLRCGGCLLRGLRCRACHGAVTSRDTSNNTNLRCKTARQHAQTRYAHAAQSTLASSRRSARYGQVPRQNDALSVNETLPTTVIQPR